ncbi:hypothetical protein [Niabella beijingensis]|uniref:hypothetical protein n=1 Tax=Niabella beijingensis TaxID=2872700 RepID=UPI001CBEBBF7|nr:hypothetical protein [Niabella beijingensis]MBZ4188371.1 hypothetical protein [Niabella beijingensis]
MFDGLGDYLKARAICTGATDEQVYNSIMNYWDWISPQPNARAHLWHYRNGGGQDYAEPRLADLFHANARIRTKIFEMIGRQLQARPQEDAGSIIGRGVDDGAPPPIGQGDYDSEDWLNANGNIDEVHWRLEGDYNPYDNRETEERAYFLRAQRRGSVFLLRVQVSIRDPYTWHPQEQRPTQCIHQAMERLKTAGAADYVTTGTTVLSMPSVYLPGWVR